MTEDTDLDRWSAAYFLGALSQTDRVAFEEYLAADPRRAVKALEFALFPSALNALTRDEALALDTAVAFHAMYPTGGAITASVAMTAHPWGTRFDWTCTYLQSWTKNVTGYDLVITTDDGQQTRVASWRPAGADSTGLAAATAIPAERIHAVDIRVSGTMAPLVVTALR